MVTIIFIGENGIPVTIKFSRDEHLNISHHYGKWNIQTNEIFLNDNAWQIFLKYRKEIRKLKPMMQQLEKYGD